MSKSAVRKVAPPSDKGFGAVARLLRLFADPTLIEKILPAQSRADRSDANAAVGPILRSKARTLLANRRARERYFECDLFGEPAWDILLALYILEDDRRRLTISAVAERTGAPLSIIVRWVEVLEQRLLVRRVDDPTNRRIVFVHLLDKGRNALDAYLVKMPC